MLEAAEEAAVKRWTIKRRSARESVYDEVKGDYSGRKGIAIVYQ